MYRGPGVYRHYKGGAYVIFGIGQDESTGRRSVAYISLNEDHQIPRGKQGITFVLRPLDVEDKDPNDSEARAFNEPVYLEDEFQPRFKLIGTSPWV